MLNDKLQHIWQIKVQARSFDVLALIAEGTTLTGSQHDIHG
jgi:hypothetical protein